MYPRNFCYWLQGKFEIDGEGATAVLSAEQVACITEHLKLVNSMQVDSNRFPALAAGDSFCQWLDGLLTGIGPDQSLSVQHVEAIRKKLNDTFLHQIDPTFSNRQQLSEIHNGHANDDSDELNNLRPEGTCTMMC